MSSDKVYMTALDSTGTKYFTVELSKDYSTDKLVEAENVISAAMQNADGAEPPVTINWTNETFTW